MNLFFRNIDNPINSYGELRKAYIANGKSKDWYEGKSAESLARFWFKEETADFTEMIKMKFGEIQLNNGCFEATTRFDNYRGGPRNHDLLFNKVICNKGQITIGIEAKGNEEYAELINKKYQYVINKKAKGQNSNIDLRLDAIFESLNQNDYDLSCDEYRALRYQLFSGLVGTIAEANLNQSDIAIFFIHQFVTHSSIFSSLQKNKRDLKRYLDFIGINEILNSGEIIEFPLKFNQTKKAKIRYNSIGLKVYIGYLITELQ